MGLFGKKVNGWKSFTIFAKSCISDVWHGSEYYFGIIHQMFVEVVHSVDILCITDYPFSINVPITDKSEVIGFYELNVWKTTVE